MLRRRWLSFMQGIGTGVRRVTKNRYLLFVSEQQGLA
jgi:hypothetical protein